MENFLKKITSKNLTTNTNKKIENIVFLIIVLIITLIIINSIWNTKEEKENKTDKEIASSILTDEDSTLNKIELESKLENILSTIKGVGKVEVFINYQESSSMMPLYDETTTTSSTEEGDSSGGTRNVTETEVQKEVVFSEKSNSKEPITQKTTMPIVQGAIVTAEGAGDATVKTNIINAVQAVTGISIDKIQVFEKENY